MRQQVTGKHQVSTENPKGQHEAPSLRKDMDRADLVPWSVSVSAVARSYAEQHSHSWAVTKGG